MPSSLIPEASTVADARNSFRFRTRSCQKTNGQSSRRYEICDRGDSILWANLVRQDTPYLSPLVDEIEAELKEREDLESMVIQKKK